jgi:group I intron endonuclease
MIKKTGIYKISNKEDGKIYIGQAKDIEKRWKTHKRTKYPEDQFTYEIIMECDLEQLNFWEIAWIASEKACDPAFGYNQALGGTDIKCIFPSDETKAKLSALNKGKVVSEETRAKLSVAHKGKVISEEMKAKVSAANMGNKKAAGGARIKKPKQSFLSLKQTSFFSDEHRINLSEAGKGRKKSDEHKMKLSKSSSKSKPCIVNGTLYISAIEAALALEINRRTLGAYLRETRSWPNGMSGYYLDKKS